MNHKYLIISHKDGKVGTLNAKDYLEYNTDESWPDELVKYAMSFAITSHYNQVSVDNFFAVECDKLDKSIIYTDGALDFNKLDHNEFEAIFLWDGRMWTAFRYIYGCYRDVLSYPETVNF